MSFPDGRKYTGQFRDGLMEGQGSAAFANGKEYTGQWKNNLFDGQGTMTYPDGGTYVGRFENGLPHGQGTMTRPDGQYTGKFKFGKRTDTEPLSLPTDRNTSATSATTNITVRER